MPLFLCPSGTSALGSIILRGKAVDLKGLVKQLPVLSVLLSIYILSWLVLENREEILQIFVIFGGEALSLLFLQ